jgi:superfamily II DNA or RNA helicase
VSASSGAPVIVASLVGANARDVLMHARDLVARAGRVSEAEDVARQLVQQAFVALRSQMVRRDLAAIPVERLKDSTAGRLRFGPLASAGYVTVLDVLDTTPSALLSVPGVGQQTATQIHAAARQVAAAIEDGLQVRVDLDPGNVLSTNLLVALNRHDRVKRASAQVREHAKTVAESAGQDVKTATPMTGRVRWFFAGRGKKERASEALSRLTECLTWADGQGIWSQLDSVTAAAQIAELPDQVWRDFERRSPEYYGLLGEIVDLKLNVAASEGFLPAEILARVHEQKLDETFLDVSLRGYQSFGARFALVQQRVIIGDEMGLGKTIQAIAAIAHIKATGGTHFLVVCPASVLINWIREVGARSRLTAYQLYGPDRELNLRRWVSRGEVGVTTFESLRALTIPAEVRVRMFVVDEAHYTKNPDTQRSRNVNAMAQRCERVLFLTGTPMENRVEEFRNLVGYLQPQLVANVGQHAIAGPDAFRKAVAPVYLRRNQEDVLTELPELVQVDEWEEFSAIDFAAYREAVAQGNFMAMRRAAFASGDPRSSAKLQRLLEIADEAGDNGRKVLVFSFFRDVLTTVHRALGPRAFGPITGDVAPAKRQALVDAFTRTDGPAVLVSQISAGGVGLNMQAASVVILCEPQVKPTTEAQAIARAHRMGQLRTVQVHRLLIQDSVDQRMLEILDSKARLFDEYARRSEVADTSPEAVDISEVSLTREVVAKEQERLALKMMDEMASSGPDHGSEADL